MAQAKVGEVTCFDVVGFIPRKQRRVFAEYHADGVELDATEEMGGPFTISVKFLETEDDFEVKAELLARYAGGEPVTIVRADGKTYEDCIIGNENPGESEQDTQKVFVISGGVLKVEGAVKLSGHVVY
jgi:hypothetical protein